MEKTILKPISITKDMFKNAPPMMMTMIKGANNTFGLLKKLTEGLEKENAKSIILLFDKNAPRNDIENPPFTIYMSTDDLILRIQQLEYLLSKQKIK